MVEVIWTKSKITAIFSGNLPLYLYPFVPTSCHFYQASLKMNSALGVLFFRKDVDEELNSLDLSESCSQGETVLFRMGDS